MRRPRSSMPSTIDTMLITIEPSSAPTNESAVKLGGKPPIVKSMSTQRPR